MSNQLTLFDIPSTRENEEGRDLEQFITIMPKSLKLDIDPDKGRHM